MLTRFCKILAALLLFLAAALLVFFSIDYIRNDQERADMTDEVRRNVPGSFVRLSNGVTHYELSGPDSGRTVVLVQGFSVPYYLWDHTFDPLVKAGFRVLRYDLYGRGYSDRPDVTYDADLFEHQLLDLLVALRIQEPIDVIGASMGGPIAVIFAARHPEKVRTVSLFDPGYSTGDRLPWQLRTFPVGEYIMCVKIAPSLPEGQKEDFVHPELYPDYFAKYAAQMHYRGFRRALLASLRNFVTSDTRQDFEAVGRSHKPVFLLWGTADKDVRFEVSKDALRDVPRAEFHPMDGAGHVAFYEQPEIVNPLLVQFLNRN
jgi:pimeloyl-ACP methyl ester carboxylesterase